MRALVVLLVFLFAADCAVASTGSQPDARLILKIQDEARAYQSLVFEIQKIGFGALGVATVFPNGSQTKLELRRAVRVCERAVRDAAKMKRLIVRANESLRRRGHMENRLRGMRTVASEDFLRVLNEDGGVLRATRAAWKALVPQYYSGIENIKKGCRGIKEDLRKRD